ncbi:MAG: cytochrome c oxidase subunit 3 [Candidatus Kapabacteria bacterium]|nr:cytochrome c oxidase subunit 3 [Candidatus Kapabacteria bacterium]
MKTAIIEKVNFSKENDHTEIHQEHVHRDDMGAKIGMWLFLLTELLLFGGLFILYMAYRFQYSSSFILAARELNVGIGALNTIILLTSSLTMALAIVAIQKNKKILSMILISATIIFALLFMVNKYFEWSAKIGHGLYPNSPTLLDKEKGEIIFFGLYYTMTGLHGLHVIIGVTLLAVMLVSLKKNNTRSDKYVRLENAGLYWHLVDLIWIFLFPLFYLIH